MHRIAVGRGPLTEADVVAVARGGAGVHLTPDALDAIGESRKTGFNPTFLGLSASYTDLIHKLGGKAMDGLYATMTVANPYLDDASKAISFWAQKYKTKFNEDPTVFSVYGYIVIQSFAAGAASSGARVIKRRSSGAPASPARAKSWCGPVMSASPAFDPSGVQIVELERK